MDNTQLALTKATLAVKRNELEKARKENELVRKSVRCILKEHEKHLPGIVRGALWEGLHSSRESFEKSKVAYAVPMTIRELKAKLEKYDEDLYVFAGDRLLSLGTKFVTSCRKQPGFHVVTLITTDYDSIKVLNLFATD